MNCSVSFSQLFPVLIAKIPAHPVSPLISANCFKGHPVTTFCSLSLVAIGQKVSMVTCSPWQGWPQAASALPGYLCLVRCLHGGNLASYSSFPRADSVPPHWILGFPGTFLSPVRAEQPFPRPHGFGKATVAETLGSPQPPPCSSLHFLLSFQ